VQIEGYEFPDELYYDDHHGWLRVEGNVATQGLTDLGQRLAKKLIFVDLPRPGRTIGQGDTLVSVESHKWVGRLPAMISGTVIAANNELEWSADLVNTSPYEAGWLAKLELTNPAELEGLMRSQDPKFAEFVRTEIEKHKKVL